MIALLYFFIALICTFAGAITGMGGGVVIKPVLDLLGDFDTASIGALSSITVLAMSLTTFARQVGKKRQTSIAKLVVLGISSAGGGVLGQYLFDIMTKGATNGHTIKIIQNSILLFLIVCIFFYMLFREKIKPLHLKNYVFYILVGLLLGVLSSFLGIGGGPLNVAILMLLFAMEIKEATFASIVTIMFAQIAKVVTILVGGGFGGYDLSMLPYMVVAGVLGGLIGSFVGKKISGKVTAVAFNLMQIAVMIICVINIITNSVALNS
ncbi:MAG: sulfite exporter TauE/SafE family protein [Clostridia bacterium]|nr:sulfite exporter TauE/SafE family protein [Clostridia bacterium]MDE6471785.1 sulfite exporter TauE/SafE family protein [Clostridia bacterium]